MKRAEVCCLRPVGDSESLDDDFDEEGETGK
jgi:hypothetical protein